MTFPIPDGMGPSAFHASYGCWGQQFCLPCSSSNHVKANAQTVRKNQKACILLWMSGGPPTIDIWDLKPGSKNGGEFQPISTKGDMQISEHNVENCWCHG